MTAAEFSRRLLQPAANGPARPSRPWGSALSVALIVLGSVGVVGNSFHLPSLLLSFDGWPAPKFWSSAELTLVGAALFALLSVNRIIAIALSASASILGFVGILGALGTFRVPLGGNSLSSAVLFFTLALAMLLATANVSPRDEERALGVAGFVVVALVGTMFGATAIGVLDPMIDRNVAGSSLQTLITSLAVGVYWLSVLWSSGRVSIESADWLPAGVGFASILTVLVLWRALTVHETLQLRAQTTQASEAQALAMEATVQTLALSLGRVAERRADGEAPEEQSRDLRALQRDLPGLEIAYFEPLHNPNERAARDASTRSPELDALWQDRTKNASMLADSISYWQMDPASRRFAIAAPSCARKECAGAVVGMVQSDRLFERLFSDTIFGFHHAVGFTNTDSNAAEHSVNADSTSLVARAVHIGEVRLMLLTWPTGMTTLRVRSKLPAIVLVMGALLSVLLLVTTSLGQNARRLATSREKARLASVLEKSTDGVWEWELVSNKADHSAGIWRNLGYTPSADNDTRHAWEALIHPEDAESFRRSLQRHLDGDSDAFEQEYRVRDRHAHWRTMVDRARVVERTPAGQPFRLLGIRADVTEARNAQAVRLLNERRFRAIFDSGFQYQLLLDLDGHVLEVNRVALEACRADVADVVGKPVFETLWWATTPSARQALRDALAAARDGNAARYEAEVRCDDGPISTLDVAIKQFLNTTGESNQLLLEARDITVRRRAEAALQEVDTLTTMGRVAARVAHEINNPLAGIQNSFLLIKGAIPVTHPHFAYVGAIEREIDRIAAVTRQLYETYRPEQDSGGGTSVRSLVSDAVSFLAQVNRGTHIRIETDFSNLPSVIQLPSAMLRQIVYNLAQNAIEASPAGQIVTITAGVSDDHFNLKVRDRGSGVPAELRERIFDPFFSTKDRGVRAGGMGLGLALVRRTVTAAGGTIEVRDAPDGGSIFMVTLPVPSGAQGEDA